MSNIQTVIPFGLAGVAIWDLTRIARRLDQIAATLK